MTCESCKSGNRTSALFCANCGKPIARQPTLLVKPVDELSMGYKLGRWVNAIQKKVEQHFS